MYPIGTKSIIIFSLLAFFCSIEASLAQEKSNKSIRSGDVVSSGANSNTKTEISSSNKPSRNEFFIETSCDGYQLPSINKKQELYKCIKNLTEDNQKTILVTGGAGFVGSHLVDNLMLDGERVIVCDNFFTGRQSNIDHWLGHPNFRLIEHDVEDPIELNVDQIYHLASPASPAHYMLDPIKTIKTNTLGTMNMLSLAKKNAARILLASTSEVYGDPEEHPQAETYWGHANPVGPRACYDESKRLSESLAMSYLAKENTSIRIARIFNTYGPRMHPNDGRVVSNFITQALGNKSLTIYGTGEQTRSFQYITDLIAGLRKIMDSNVTSPINLGNPDEMTIYSLAIQVKKTLPNSTSELIYQKLPIDDPNRRRPDITKARTLLNWCPEIKLLDGLKRTIDYFNYELNVNK